MSSTSNDNVESRLVTVGEQLQVPSNTLQITQVRLNQLSNEPDVDEESLDDVAAAALALSCREDGLPVSEHDIAKAWSEALDRSGDEIAISHQQLEAVASYLDIGDVPPHPDALVQGFGEQVEMPEELITVAHRLLHDAYETDPTVVAGGPSPAATAGAVLSLAALLNDEGDSYGQDQLGKTSGTNEVTVRNRCRELRELLGEDRLEGSRYDASATDESDADVADSSGDTQSTADTSQDTQSTTDSSGDTQSTAADGAGTTTSGDSSETSSSGDGEAYLETVNSMYPDELPTTTSLADAHDTSEDAVEQALESLASSGEVQRKRAGSVVVWIPAEQDVGTDLTVDAVETEVDALVEDLGIGASTRLLARGMVSDAADEVSVEDAAKLAGATVVAATRMEDGDVDTIEVAEQRSFEPRDLSQWLDTLEDTVDVDIPRRGPEEIIQQLVEELDLSTDVRDESLLSLDRYEPAEADTDYTAAELGAGAVVFAATVSRAQVDLDDLSAISGADPTFISEAMNSIVVSLCLGLVQGEIDYDDCSWTTDLLESELSPDIGDSHTGRVIAVAKTYTAGREGRHIDDSTLDVVLGED